MSTIDVILSRRSIRRYESRPIPEESLNLILEAGRNAPSAANRQPWHFIVVRDQELKEKLSRWRYTGFLKDAALVIVGCAQPSFPVPERFRDIDVTIALENIVIAAWSLGIGSCWIGGFNEGEVKELLNIPVDQKVVALLSLGFPAEQPSPRTRKPLQEIVHYDRF